MQALKLAGFFIIYLAILRDRFLITANLHFFLKNRPPAHTEQQCFSCVQLQTSIREGCALVPGVSLLCWATWRNHSFVFYDSFPLRKMWIIMSGFFGKKFEIYGWTPLCKNRVLLIMYLLIVQLSGYWSTFIHCCTTAVITTNITLVASEVLLLCSLHKLLFQVPHLLQLTGGRSNTDSYQF